ncbi:hypothetical protein GPECTOR_13g809 [Gonium pectorale]|uniref:RTA1 protein n=1 Tax=Gonium pectorale TaxID=33097 RepID=A0A150GNL2_GONPE|nr:hypothetical protein GPECTOR_13g809 [Gonium pectorale]|eukprot:KXZ51322.1 hypothetical protein GPECTOR_13g809 [Gonium pectorale]
MVDAPALSKEEFLMRVFHEIPKEVPAYIALFLYFAVGAVMLFLTYRTRAWFMLCVTVTAWFEVIGFAIRLLMIKGPNPTLGQFIGMQAILIITPVLLPIADYIMVGRLMTQGDASKLRIKPHWVARLFTASDIISLVVQSGGAGLISSDNPSTQKMGTGVMLVGLALQLGFFSCFTVIAVYVHKSRVFALRNAEYWRPVFLCMYLTIALMYVRNIFRVAEFATGYDGYLASHEVFFYVFDFAVLFVCICVFCCYHYGFYPVPEYDSDAVHPMRDAPSQSGPVGQVGCCGVIAVKPHEKAGVCEMSASADVPGAANNV